MSARTMRAQTIRRLAVTAGRIAVCNRDLQGYLDERDVLIIEALRAGASEREVAAVAGISGPRVHQIKAAWDEGQT